MFDLCVVGHVTREVVVLGSGKRNELPGGTAYYTSLALRGLGLAVAVVTKVEAADDALTAELRRQGVAASVSQSRATTTFENRYRRGDPNTRVQRVGAVADPFSPEDLEGIDARAIHLGPLTNRDMGPAVIETARARARLVSLDVQGLVREVAGGGVRQRDWAEKERALASIDILKADEEEATILSGAPAPADAAHRLAGFGPKEVIVTLGSRGSIVLAGGRLSTIPAFPARGVLDPTGCGDTYMAGYLFKRLEGEGPQGAARFAAALATLKLERAGPLGARPEEATALAGRR